jgi:hypothetical protein
MTGINLRSGEKRVNINGLGERPKADCKTVYPGSIPGVASSTYGISFLRTAANIAKMPKLLRNP